jgi:hypothetical protein
MKRISTLFLITLLILSGCGSAKKSLIQGNYDEAINRAVDNLRRNPRSEKDILSLEQAMNIALEQDNERIRYLKTEGRADSWDAIYQIYQKMYNRQMLVRTVTPLNYQGRTIEFPYVDYLVEITTAKRNAADFYFAHAKQLMEEGRKESYRQAYAEFLRVKDYVGDYNQINDYLEQTRYLGISRALIRINNNSLVNFPAEYDKELLNINVSSLNTDWIEYYTTVLNENMELDYIINVNINTIGVSPDQQFEIDTLVKKNIEDGFEYVLDSRGNVRKDSLGNDMKTPKYKTLQCALIQTIQQKECTIQGVVDFVELRNEQILRTEPIAAVSSFENVSARAIGDVEALNAQQKEMIKTATAPFPTDFDMIFMCSDALKISIREALQRNRGVIL